MLPVSLEKFYEGLPQLFPYFAGTDSLEADVAAIGRFVSGLTACEKLMVVRLDDRNPEVCREAAIWGDADLFGPNLHGFLQARLKRLLALLGKQESLTGPELEQLLTGGGIPALCSALFPLRFEGRLAGLLLVQKTEAPWRQEELELAAFAGKILGAALSDRTHLENEELYRFVFNTVMDGMQASLYITDPATDRILFMNRTMREQFGIEHPEGKVCWQVLQKGMHERCPFCPIKTLLESGSENPSHQWEEKNPVTGRTYQNYDSLIRWLDGSIVHFQQSIDVTELKSAYTDELTRMMTRRAGKEALRKTLEKACENGETVTVCMYDVNLLKEINDIYGHAEGDRILAVVAEKVREVLTERDYAFRLSGDEFIVVFLARRKNVQSRMQGVLRKLESGSEAYRIGFCYGLVEVQPDRPISLEEVLTLADERMYEHKRSYHILYNERKRKNGFKIPDMQFSYDKERLYHALVQSTDDYVYVCNLKTGVFRYTPAMVEEFGLPGEVIENAAAVWGAKVHENDRQAFLESNQEIADGRATSHCVEYRVMNRHGEWVWVRCRGHVELDDDGEPVLFAGFITNLGKKNNIDHLTGLFNKFEFEDQIQHLLESDPDKGFAVMVLGIDDLKHINDLYDRFFGDEVIRITSQKLRVLLPNGVFVYRLDGDEFGVIARDTGVEGIQKIYRKIRQTFQSQQEYEGKKYYCTLSAGCLFYPQDAQNYLDLFKYAGYSLEYAKSHGKKRCVFYSKDILAYRTRALELVELLRESVENDFSGFRICFQPIVNAVDGTLAGVEALSRWHCGKYGEVSPVEFIPLLEKSGLIIPVGKWVLRTAVRACKSWNRPGLAVNVNLSYLQLEDSDFVAFLRGALEEEAYSPRDLVVELTESAFAKEDTRVQKIFREIREMGVRIAMDDFGTGYSALGILKKSPADLVKIDKAFIKDIRISNFDATFIRFVVALCHDVGIQVCLEGVETEAEYKVVSEMGLDFIQGYLFGRPMEERDFLAVYPANPKEGMDI